MKTAQEVRAGNVIMVGKTQWLFSRPNSTNQAETQL